MHYQKLRDVFLHLSPKEKQLVQHVLGEYDSDILQTAKRDLESSQDNVKRFREKMETAADEYERQRDVFLKEMERRLLNVCVELMEDADPAHPRLQDVVAEDEEFDTEV